MKGFAGDPEAHKAHLRGCVLRGWQTLDRQSVDHADQTDTHRALIEKLVRAAKLAKEGLLYTLAMPENKNKNFQIACIEKFDKATTALDEALEAYEGAKRR